MSKQDEPSSLFMIGGRGYGKTARAAAIARIMEEQQVSRSTAEYVAGAEERLEAKLQARRDMLTQAAVYLHQGSTEARVPDSTAGTTAHAALEALATDRD